MQDQEPEPMRMARLTWVGSTAVFVHENGAARNALTEPLRQDYSELPDRLRARRDTRALIITGSAGSFSAGGDVKAMNERLASADPEVNSPDATRRRLDHSQTWLRSLRELDMPIIAAVDGPAYGAGFCLALMADFILASPRASFCMSFVKVGCTPDFGAFHTLPRWVGLARAKELMLTGRTLRAPEARDLGMVLALHEPDRLMAEALELASRLASGPREALALTRRLLNQSYETDYAAMALLESAAQAICMAAPFHRDAVANFVAGRPSAYDWGRAPAAGGERTQP